MASLEELLAKTERVTPEGQAFKGVLDKLPGMAGYFGAGDLINRGADQSRIRGKIAQQDESMVVIKDVLQRAGGDPEKAIKALMATGDPIGVEMATKIRSLAPKPGLVQIGSGGLYDKETNTTIAPVKEAKETDEWSEPYQLKGATVQRNKKDGQIRPVVPREPASSVVDPNNSETIAKAISEYRQAPITGFGLRSPGAQQIMARVNELNPQYDAKEYSNRLMGERGFLTRQGQAIRGFNVVIDHLDTAQELFNALKNGDVQIINKARNEFKKQFGVEAPVSVNAAKQFIAAEAVRAVTGAAGALGDREEMAKNLNPSLSDAQFLGTVNTIKKLAVGQLQGNEQQYRSVTGNKEDFKERFLTPGSRKAWEEFGKKANAPAPSGGIQEFATEADAARANLAPGTRVKIGGQTGVWQ